MFLELQGRLIVRNKMDHCPLLNPEDQVAWFSLNPSDYLSALKEGTLMIQFVWNRIVHGVVHCLGEG